ncbi:MAG: hypothetical protein AAFO29_05945, partial [Actinomycetota bacterium]
TRDVLSDVVAGTSFVDGELTFDGTAGLDVIARLAPGTEPAASTLTLLPGLDGATPDGVPGGLALTTFSIESPEQALVEAGELTPSLTETMVGDRPAHQYSVVVPGQESVAIIAWSPADGYGAYLAVWGLTAAEATEYAASLVPVDGTTWAETLAELG